MGRYPMKSVLTSQERLLLWLSVNLGSSSARVRRMLEAFDGSIEEVFRAAAKGKLPKMRFLDDEKLSNIQAHANERYIERIINRLDELDVKVSTLYSENYPILLKNIYDPPAVLYYKGTLYPELRLPIAIVGAREPSDYGRRVTRELAEELASAGACIVSGLAYGLDRVAAEGALDAEGNDYPTIAVLGTGPNVVYPSVNRDVYELIAERGAVVSEFMPGIGPKPSHFPMRNRIISGLSKGVVVVEARTKSGTSITVDCALEQGRDVFAVPGRVSDELSGGTNDLIREGMAKITLSAQDVLEEYGMKPRSVERKAVAPSELPFEQQLIHRLLIAGERTYDELAELTGFDAGKLNSTLTEMEFSGIIKQSPGRLYSL